MLVITGICLRSSRCSSLFYIFLPFRFALVSYLFLRFYVWCEGLLFSENGVSLLPAVSWLCSVRIVAAKRFAAALTLFTSSYSDGWMYSVSVGTLARQESVFLWPRLALSLFPSPFLPHSVTSACVCEGGGGRKGRTIRNQDRKDVKKKKKEKEGGGRAPCVCLLIVCCLHPEEIWDMMSNSDIVVILTRV